MATISKKANCWFVQIRRKGCDPEHKSLPTEYAVERWAREREGRTNRGEEPLDRRALRDTSVGDLICRYIGEITRTKASADAERMRLTKM